MALFESTLKSTLLLDFTFRWQKKLLFLMHKNINKRLEEKTSVNAMISKLCEVVSGL